MEDPRGRVEADGLRTPLAHLDGYFERNRRALVGMVIAEEPGSTYLASGVAVRLGGKPFILTAAHNVWSDRRFLATAMGAPTERIATLIRPGNGSTGRVYIPPTIGRADPEPDVAVVEPTKRTILPPEPFDADDIGFFDTTLTSEISETHLAGYELVVAGFPTGMASFQPSPTSEQPTMGSLSVGINSMRVWSIPASAGDRLTFSKEPREGRGVHVYISVDVVTEDGLPGQTVDPKGMSGGPLVVPEGKGILVGLMRGKMDFHQGWDMWCEPAAEAVRLLVDHDDNAVAEEARRVVQRYDDALAAFRSRHATP